MQSLEINELDLTDLTESVESSVLNPDNITEVGELKDNIVVDLCNQLKEKFNQVAELEIKIINRKKRETKQILKIYGLIKSIEKMTEETIEVPRELQCLIDITADMIEDFIEDEFFAGSDLNN
jgi:hypothetical protein